MVTINGSSQNWNGVISYNGENVADVNGTVAGDAVYISLNSQHADILKTKKADVAADLADFVETVLA